jgi:hypothetical protein
VYGVCTGAKAKKKKNNKNWFSVRRVRQRPSTHASENGILTSLSYHYCCYYDRNQLDTCSSSSFSASGNPNKHLDLKTSFYGGAFTRRRRRSEKYYHHRSIRNLSSSCISFFFFLSLHLCPYIIYSCIRVHLHCI